MPNLLKEILDRIEYERLIEEGKDPVELLHYKFQNVPTEIIDSVINIDPTKKKTYSQWLLSKWDDEKDTIINNLKNGRIAKLFKHYKAHQDIQIRDCPSVKEGLDKFVPEEDTVLVKSSAPTTTLMNDGWTKEVPSELANDFDIVFNEDNWLIAVPNTYEADCKLGENMKWCTGGGRTDFEGGEYYYNHYLDDYGGKYYVNFDMSEGESRLGKDYPFTRYQFHFETNQFMDKEDEEVEITEIGMPESAREFYSNEGYDLDDYGNLEGRMYRYEEQRWGSAYRINDDLILNIEYDEDYVFTEPDESTDYYIFNEDDDRDPICWACIPNPNSNEGVVIVNEPDFVLLKSARDEDEAVAVYKKTNPNNYNNYNSYWWSAKSLKEYINVKDGVGVYGIDDSGYFNVISPDISSDYRKREFHDVENLFINEQCTSLYSAEYEENTFVEVVENGYHSLFNISISPQMGDDLICVVYRDVPANGEYFTINENGLIEGEFRTYRVYNDDEYGDEEQEQQYDLEYKINSTGDYLISAEVEGQHGSTHREYNILKKGSNKPLIDTWFDSFNGSSKNLYGVRKDKKTAFFSISDGHQVGKWYDYYTAVDATQDILIGHVGDRFNGMSERIDIISGFKGAAIAQFHDNLTEKPVNNKLVVRDNDLNTKVFDYVECKFCFQELSYFNKVSVYEYPFMFACNINETEEKCIFDLETEKILVRGIKDFTRISRANARYCKLIKMNNKYNVFDFKEKTELLNGDVDDITSINDYVKVLIYYANGKYYPYNYQSGNILINPNGISFPTYIEDSNEIYCLGEDYMIYFVRGDNSDDYKIYSWRNRSSYRDSGTYFEPNRTPQEVMNMYNIILGQQESITKKFKNYMSRIDEVTKHKYNDIID